MHPPDALLRDCGTAPLRRAAARCLEAALHAADAGAAVRRAVRRDGGRLRVGSAAVELGGIKRIYVLGAGKAGAPMAAALREILGKRLAGGLVVVKHGYRGEGARPDLHIVEAGHPIPDAAGMRAAEEVLALAREAGDEDLVFVLLSGGGSALLALPVPGVTLEEKMTVTRLLLEAGAPIQELNAVRKHLSRIKGGRLGREIAPARMITLLLSDVLGNPPDVIASGPTVPDPTTYAGALDVLDRRGLTESVPPAVIEHLRAGAAGTHPETPKPGDPTLASAITVVVGDLEGALDAAAAAAIGEGFRTISLSSSVEGEAREVGAAFGRQARSAHGGRFGPPPVCLVQGGETTVTVRGPGRGGRNQEVALAAAMEIAGLPHTLVLSAGTDGTDGPTDAAGAVVDGDTIARAAAAGLDPASALDRNDSYPFFAALGDLLVTGPTLTNVNDLMLALIGGVLSD